MLRPPDIHPDEFYRAHSSTDEAEACHRGKGPAGAYGAETSDCDSPFALVNATFDWIDAHIRDQVDFVVWTGDSARHDSDEEIPRNQAQVLGTNRWIAEKFLEVFTNPRAGRGPSVPVIPTLGNNDILPHNILLTGPNAWLQHYTGIWRHFIPEAQRHSFEFGGWFFVEVIPDRLAVISLNTLYFFDRNAGVDGCANPSEPGYKQMEWLRVQLQFMRERGMKAILMGHVPPARTDSKKLWDETCWQRYTLWLQQFRDVVISGLYGHMNIDHFLIQDTHDIDLDVLSGFPGALSDTRHAMQDELSVNSAADYLQELRDNWSKLNPPPSIPNKDKKDGTGGSTTKGKKGRRRKDMWGERYQLTLVGPSIVPNYFPTLRIIEYNITGLEKAPTWADKLQASPPLDSDRTEQKHLDLRSTSDVSAETEVEAERRKKGGKKHKKKPKKDKKPHDPYLIIPDPPSRTSAPGPAYSAQTLSLTGFTQYYANLTYINNLTLDTQGKVSEPESNAPSWLDGVFELLRWRRGKHSGKKPATPKPQPREFYFEVEYSTFDDKTYKLKDLTVNSFVDLAYRMGQKAGKRAIQEVGSDSAFEEEEEGDYEEDEEDDDSDSDDEDTDDEMEAERAQKKHRGRKGDKKKKKKKGGKKKKRNEVWLKFLSRAFVGTVEKQELKKYG